MEREHLLGALEYTEKLLSLGEKTVLDVHANGKQVVAASVARYIARISETSEVSVEPSAGAHRVTL